MYVQQDTSEVTLNVIARMICTFKKDFETQIQNLFDRIERIEMDTSTIKDITTKQSENLALNFLDRVERIEKDISAIKDITTKQSENLALTGIFVIINDISNKTQ